MKVKPLYKATIVIWSDSDPRNLELSDLAREAESGECYCSSLHTKIVEAPEHDPDWDGTDFFGPDWADPGMDPGDRFDAFRND